MKRQSTETWTVTTIAGTAGVGGSVDGTISFNNPNTIAVDSFGNIYVADGGNHL